MNKANILCRRDFLQSVAGVSLGLACGGRLAEEKEKPAGYRQTRLVDTPQVKRDFTGDGIDDFAACSHTSSSGTGWWAEVNVFAGYDPNATDVPYDYEPTVPADFRLSHNYPNPFNPSTAIEFSLPERGQTALTVYNLLGRTVCTLVDKLLPAGDYTLRWDGMDESGQDVASGVYIYRLTSGEFTQSRKMLLVR